MRKSDKISEKLLSKTPSAKRYIIMEVITNVLVWHHWNFGTSHVIILLGLNKIHLFCSFEVWDCKNSETADVLSDKTSFRIPNFCN